MQYVEFRKYPDKPKICPYVTMDDYIQYLLSYLTICHNSFFVITVPLYSPASWDSLKRWGIEFLRSAGVPTNFKLHSTQAAHASKSIQLGDSLDDVMNRCAWAQSSTFFTYYLHPLEEVSPQLVQKQIQVKFYLYEHNLPKPLAQNPTPAQLPSDFVQQTQNPQTSLSTGPFKLPVNPTAAIMDWTCKKCKGHPKGAKNSIRIDRLVMPKNNILRNLQMRGCHTRKP